MPELQQRLKRHWRLLAGVAAAVTLIFVVGLWAMLSGLPSRDELRNLGEMPQASTLYDVHNRPVFTIFKEYRIEVPLSQVSPHLRKAIVAFEDQRFAEHSGIDIIRIVGAVWADVREGRKAQGGSTITQQLARQSFLTREKKIWRKVQEIALARRIERMYSKDEILELYLNKVYFGDGLHGAEAAARGYFGKSASDLDLAEAALLAGLVNAPSVNAPTVNMSRAVARRGLVLNAMRAQGIITDAAFERASSEKVRLVDNLRREEPLGQHFKEEVRQQLVKQFGWERLSEGGLKVYTTIDPDMQRAAEANVEASVKQIEMRRAKRKIAPTGEQLEAALVAMDPTTGEVRALVGGRDFKNSRFNRATQAMRQPGSAFKPFVYASALEAGYSPASLVTRLDEPIQTLEGAWMPEDEHSDGAEMTVRTALRTSSNRAAVRMLEEVGIAKTVAQARKMGIGNVPSVPSLALGSGEVTLMAMTSAYGAFADEWAAARGHVHPTRGGFRGQGSVRLEARSRAGFVSADRVPHDEHALGCCQFRNGIQGPAGGVHVPGSWKDRDDERLRRRMVRGLHTASRDRRVGRVRQAAHHHLEWLRGRACRADVGAFHESGDGERQA